MEVSSIPNIPTFALLFFILVIAVSNTWKSTTGANFIVLSWICLLIGRLPIESSMPTSIALAFYASTQLLFPIFSYIGSLKFVGAKVPKTLLPLTAVVILSVYVMMILELKTGGILSASLVNLLCFIGAARLLAFNLPTGIQSTQLKTLSAAYLLFALLSVWGTAALFYDIPNQYYLTIWSLVAGITAALQVSTFLRGKKRERDHLRRKSDITAAQLSVLHARLQSIVENTYDMIIETDGLGKVLYITPNVVDILGYTQETAINANISDAFHRDDIDQINSWEQSLGLEAGQMHDPVRARHQDGSWHWLESSVRQYSTASNEIRRVISLRDVTERIEQQEQLQNFQTRFEAMALNSNDVIIELSTNGSLNYVTPNAALITGYPLNKLTKLTVIEILNLLKAEPFTSKTGTNQSWQEEFKTFEKASELIDKQQRIITADGKAKWVEIEASTYKRASGETNLIAIVRDITERTRTSEQLQKSKLMESLGLIASGVAHDFNNLLAIIQGNAELSSDDIGNGDYEHAQQMLGIIRSASAQAADLTSQLLTYAGKGSFQWEDVNINTIIKDLKSLLSVAVPRATLQYDLANSVPKVRADPTQIRQIIMNLVINAGEAAEDISDGTITISTSVINQKSGSATTNSVCLTVKDNGKGMDSNVSNQIFEPFFTTKFDGRGLGLAAVFGIVSAHDGRISVESSLGEGSVLQVILPSVQLNSETFHVNSENKDQSRVLALSQGHTNEIEPTTDSQEPMILIVDDESNVREVIVKILAGKGYRVIAANGSTEALRAYRNHQQLALCIIDYSLPSTTGIDLYQQLINIDDDLQVIYMSGYDQATIEGNNQAQNTGKEKISIHRGQASAGFIQKPFTASELLAAIDGVRFPLPKNI